MSDFKIVCDSVRRKDIGIEGCCHVFIHLRTKYCCERVVRLEAFSALMRMNVWFPTNNNDMEHAVRVVRGG